MFHLTAKLLTQAINAAKQLKSDVAILYAGKHGVLFGTRSDAGTFLTLLSTVKHSEFSVLLKLEDLTTATHRVSEMDFDIQSDHVIIRPKGIRSVIRLAAEPAKPGDMLELWESRSNGKSAPMLTRMLSENHELFCIKDHVGGKPVPVHIRWNKEGVAAGMSDIYHGVSVRSQKAPLSKKEGREVFVYSSWLRLLLDFLRPENSKDKVNDKDALPVKVGKVRLSLTENNVSVSTDNTLLVLQAIVPGAETVTLDDIAQIANSESKNKLKINMADCNAALQRSLAVLPREAAIKFVISEKKPEVMRIEGLHDSGSRIVEEISTSRAKKSLTFSSTIYNLLDVTAASVPSCEMRQSGKAILFGYDYASITDTIYRVDLFSVVTAG